jgi:hypothetical protein
MFQVPEALVVASPTKEPSLLLYSLTTIPEVNTSLTVAQPSASANPEGVGGSGGVGGAGGNKS